MQVSKNINKNEIACHCGCGFSKASTALIEMIQDVRDHFNKPVKITSCCRCKKHNTKVGGAEKSKHLPDLNNVSRGADISIKNVSILELANYLLSKYPYSCGIGIYNTWVHIDDRVKRARWNKSTKGGK